jgi:Leu/Phe-tRNA-protein transferase
MQFKIAELSDIDATLKLHAKYQVDNIAQEDKADGFVTTAFTKEELTRLIVEEQGLFIAKDEDVVLGYVMAGSWEFWSQWAMFRFMIEDLPNLEFLGQKLSTENSYQYGPVCIDKSVRGSGILEFLFDMARAKMSRRYPILVTFVNKINRRSYEAHRRKLGLTVIQEFTYNGNEYYQFAYDTAIKKVPTDYEDKKFYTGRPFICVVDYAIEYLDYDSFLDSEVMDNIYEDIDKHYYWSDDFSAEYYVAQAKAGFIAVTMEQDEELLLTPEIQKSYAILHFKDLHISKKVKRLLKKKNLQIEIAEAFDEVYESIKKFHSISWLKKEYIEILKAINELDDENFRAVTVVIRDNGKAVAGEVGYMIGRTYTSLAGFSSRDKEYANYGTAQLVLLAQYLEENDFAFLNLGQPYMPYKLDMGAKVYERKKFLRFWKSAIKSSI